MSLVSLIKCEGSKEDQIKKAIYKSLAAIEYHFPKNVRDVVIKPNLCYYWDCSTGETTDPKFIEVLVDIVREQISSNVGISVVESDASAMRCKHAFKMLGYETMASKCNVSLVNLSEDQCENVETTVSGIKFNFMLPQTIAKAQLRINVPKIKYMEHVKVSCALKNIYGCNPYPKKFKFHPRLDETIVALNKSLKFDLSILDGLIVSGAGPHRLNLVMASSDLVAHDTVAAKIAGINPKSINHIMLAQQEKLGTTKFIPRGIKPQYFEAEFPRRRTEQRLKALAYTIVKTTKLSAKLGL